MPSNSNNGRRTKTTSKIKTQNKNKTPKGTNKKKGTKRKMNPKLKMFLKILLVIFLLLCVVGAGIVAAMFFGLFGDEFEISKEELIVGTSNTIVVDKDGKEIANLSSDEKRKTVSLSEMSPYLPKAYIAIEDKRFYSHNGVDIKRTAGAILGTETGNSSYGGSSITQQLVKNITKDKAQMFDTKYQKTAVSIMEQAKEKFLVAFKSINYKQGTATSILSDIMKKC